nr:hypothetical protein [Candidatus Sigynarchaeota archaeon]
MTYGDPRIVRSQFPNLRALIQYPDERVSFRVGVNGAGPFIEIWHPGATGTTVTGWACSGKRIDPTVGIVYRAIFERLRQLKNEVKP